MDTRPEPHDETERPLGYTLPTAPAHPVPVREQNPEPVSTEYGAQPHAVSMADAAPAEPPRPPFVPDPELDGPPDAAAEPFAPPAEQWRRVSPKLVGVKRISASITIALIFIPVAVAVWFLFPEVRWVAGAVLAAGAALWLWLFVRAARVVARYGWARRDNDLAFTEGLMWRSLKIVPFGRLQVVRVSSGPLLRSAGLSNVELVTASPSSSVTIPGLPADEAVELRDLMIELSDAEGSGL